MTTMIKKTNNKKNKTDEARRARMKVNSPLKSAEIIKHDRLANVAKASRLISQLKKLLPVINEKEMIGDEPQQVLNSLDDLETAFDEFRSEYAELFKKFQDSTGKRKKENWY